MRHRREYTSAAPAPPPGSLNPPELIRQSTIMTPFKVYEVRMTEQDRTYCTSLARKLTALRGLARYQDHYRALNGQRSRLYPGVLAGLEAFREQGARLAVVTNKGTEFAIPLLRQMSLDGYFDAVVCGDTCERKKPDPMPLFHACDLLGITPAQALFIGHLNPAQIVAFHVRPSGSGGNVPWERISREEFIQRYQNEITIPKEETWKERVFEPNEPFNGEKFMTALKARYKDHAESGLRSMWFSAITAPKQKALHFAEKFDSFLWPRQMPEAIRWFAKTYGTKSGADD